MRPWASLQGISNRQHAAVFLLACVVLVTRRPDALFHAQFWAEDGHAWFADAFNLGWWRALSRAQDGYFQTFPRLAAGLALLVPLALAPLVLNAIAIALQALPANLLLSSRSSPWGGLRHRALLAAIYLALPNCRELSTGITESQWLLAFCVFLLLVGAAPASSVGRIFEVCLLVLCGSTGPFCFFLAPLAAFMALRQSSRWNWSRVGILELFCFVQAWGLLVVDAAGRAPGALGATPMLFVRILAADVYLGALLGSNGIEAIPGMSIFIFLVLVALSGTTMMATCFMRSPVQLKLLILLSAMLLAASLISPAAYPPPGITRWQLLAQAGGIRYWFFPTLAFAWSLLALFNSRRAIFKVVGGYLIFFFCIGIVRDWRHPAFKDLNFASYAQQVTSAPAGTALVIPENPNGWIIRLVKQPERK